LAEIHKAQALKRVFLGRPMASGELEHTLLPKIIALPVFSSDPLSSNAYATQEALLVLVIAGAVGLKILMPLVLAVAILLWIVVTSYRQTVMAYPSGGGAYRVSRENLGMVPGLLAASALLIDYVLTVAVSVTAGVEAITSAAEGLFEYRILIAFGFIALVTLINLRGAKESGTLFAIPTYGFVLSIYLMIVTGLIKCVDGCPQAESASLRGDLDPESALTFFLVLRAFAAGTTALTGVEAIADGVPAFRFPQSRNAAKTLVIMAALSTSMFLGISWLADHTDVVYLEGAEGQRSVVAQIAFTVFGGGFFFYLVQAMSAAILILAANTAYQDFPRLSSILSRDRFMPSQFRNRGDRLVFSNGVIILALLAALLIYVFEADLTRLIQLYLVGVFISFTLSQSGMVVKTRKDKPAGWKRTMIISGFGASVTGTVLFVIAGTKFILGAWIVLAAIPIVMYTMYSIHRHYSDVADQLTHESRRPVDRRPGNEHVIIFVPKVDAAVARAVGYARSIRPDSLRAVTTDRTHNAAWRRLAPEIPLDDLPGGSLRKRVKSYLESHRETLPVDDFMTFIVPEILEGTGTFEILRHPGRHLLKASLLRTPGVQVLDVPILREQLDPLFDEAQEPARNYVLVLVAGLHNATLQAIEYAETLRPTDLRAVSFGLDPEDPGNLAQEWLDARVPHPLEIEASPFRDIGESLSRYVEQFQATGTNRVVTVVLPEYVVAKNRHQILHNQTALIVKRRMLFERGVHVASVPYHLGDVSGRSETTPV
jgi:amino acid transporter